MIRKNLTPLAFYASLDEQLRRNTGPYAGAKALFIPTETLIPFQVIVQSGDGIDTAYIVPEGTEKLGFDEGGWTELTSFYPGQLTYTDYASDGYGIVTYVPAAMISRILEGRYSIVVYLTSGAEYWSDHFVAVADHSGMLTVTWSSEKDLVCRGGRVAYEGTGYVNMLYIPAELSFPDYKFDEEGEERNGYNFPSKQTSEKTYKFTFGATEGMCDGLRLARLSDNVTVTDRYGNTYICDTFLITPSALEGGYMAQVECEFETDTVVVQAARAIDGTDDVPVVSFNGQLVDEGSIISLPYHSGGGNGPVVLVAETPASSVAIESDIEGWRVENRSQFIYISFDGEYGDESTTADITLETNAGTLTFSVSASSQ